MKRLIYNLFISLLAVNLVFTSCSPDNHELASVDLTSDDLVEGLAYTITADANNPNIIYLESKLDNSYTPLWEHPMGRSQEKKVTLNMAFEGTYSVRFGAMTRAGVVYGEPSTFEIAQFNASFVSGDMWEYLAGGAGNSKTWIPDDGTYNMKQGFYSCFDPTATPADMTCDEGKNNWYPVDKTWWEPSNADIGITEDDLKSYMVFSLQGKAGLTLHRFTNNQEVVTEGLFSMNTDEKKMSAIDVEFLHGEWANGKSVDFKTDFMILVLTENQMMIANFRDEALSGEGRCVYCWNFVSKDYADNYVPPTEEPTPDLPDGWLNDVTQIVNTTLKFKLSETTPYNWFNLDGSVKNNFTSLSDYPASLAPISSALGIDLVLRSATNEYSISAANGESIDGNYEITSDGFYFFNNGLPDYAIGNNDIYFRANNDNSLRLLNYTVSAGAVTDIWLGLPQIGRAHV